MHNTSQENLEFQITFTEGNLRYLLGDNPRNEKLINKTKTLIVELKSELEKMKLDKNYRSKISGCVYLGE